MRIAFFIQDISTQGGTERTTCCIANEMVRHGHSVSIVSVFQSSGQVQYPLSDAVQVVYLSKTPYSGILSALKRFQIVIGQLSQVRQCANLRVADVIISQKFLASLLAYYAGFAHKTLACEHYRYGMYNRLVRWYRDKMYHRFRGLVVLTSNDKRMFEGRGVENVFVVENMVSISPMPWQGIDRKVALSVGRLDRQKGYDLLLEALAMYKSHLGDWRFDIYGDGAERETLEAQRHRLGLDEMVRFEHFTSHIEEVYATHGFYILSSRFEGFPMVLLEAAAAGLPIVSFDCKEGPRVLLQNGGGLLAEAENVSELGKMIVRMATDDELRNRLQQEVCRVVEPYSPEAIYNKWINVFDVCKII